MKMDASIFARRITKLPSLPSLYYQLVQVMNNPYADLEEISQVVRQD